MAIASGTHRWPWLVLLGMVACFGAVVLGFLACGSHGLHVTQGSIDVAVTEPGGASGDEPTAAVRVEAGTTAADTSSSPCSIVSGKYGACDQVLGWGFDGKVCRQWTGCDCAPDCAQMAASAQGCAQTCRKQGRCNTEALVSRGVATFAIGGSCDNLVACVPAGLETELGLQLAGSCQSGGTCGDVQTCPVEVAGAIDQAQWNDYCTASLVSGVRLECFQRLL
jgi:hypothetical protein